MSKRGVSDGKDGIGQHRCNNEHVRTQAYDEKYQTASQSLAPEFGLVEVSCAIARRLPFVCQGILLHQLASCCFNFLDQMEARQVRF